MVTYPKGLEFYILAYTMYLVNMRKSGNLPDPSLLQNAICMADINVSTVYIQIAKH